MPRTRGLAHVNLHVSNFDRSMSFYVEVFGLKLLDEDTETLQRGGQPIELRQAVLSTPGREGLLALTYGVPLPVGNCGLNHIDFNFESDEDIRTAIDAALHYGGKVVRDGEREEGGIRETFAYV